MSNKKFEVHYEKVFELSLVVEAKNEDDARARADQILLEDYTKEELLEKCQEGHFEYTYTDEVE